MGRNAIPASVREWHWHAVCCGCGRSVPALDGTVRSVRDVACERCGQPVSAGWGMVRRRWVSQARWWWPGSWGRGWWETEG